ncbi:hypothetical protein [Gluconobacter japonicus]|uniref:DUF7673 family protein n=1 Tax=Gluconobacter japonicus TaxID=376620 RepID=UPI001B8B44C6|nr:hypothetical protein [Gluconobacter japonicus]MBS1051138.1 hypothetical protein [Gluconobacter japonicus]
MNEETRKSLSNLISIAHGQDKHQVCIRDFLLSWWNESTFGIFDMHRLSCLDDGKRKDVANVFSYLCEIGFTYPSQRTPYFDRLERLANREWEKMEELRVGDIFK